MPGELFGKSAARRLATECTRHGRRFVECQAEDFIQLVCLATQVLFEIRSPAFISPVLAWRVVWTRSSQSKNSCISYLLCVTLVGCVHCVLVTPCETTWQEVRDLLAGCHHGQKQQGLSTTLQPIALWRRSREFTPKPRFSKSWWLQISPNCMLASRSCSKHAAK